MKSIVEQFSPREDDLIVVPDTMDIPENPGFLVSKIKHLYSPSIIRSGGGVHMLESLNTSKFSGKGILSMIFGTKGSEETDIGAGSGDIGNTSMTLSLETPSNPPRFLRHVRRYDLTCIDDIPMLSKGGLTFAVDIMPAENKFRFSYAICNDKDLFNKRTAGNICNGRLENLDYYEISFYETAMSITDNIEIALYKLLNNVFDDGTIQSPKFTMLSQRSNETELKKIHKIIKDAEYALS